jgi:hypothetical protein
MPINRDMKVFFIHIPKTGGTTIEHLLAIDSKPNNVEQLFGVSSDGWVLHTLPLRMITSYISREEMETYFKFAIVRNPWDRLVSDYFWHKRRRSFKEFVYLVKETLEKHTEESLVHFDPVLYRHHFVSQSFMLDSEEIKLDFIGRFENFEKDIKLVAKKIGLDLLTVPTKNKMDHLNYRSYYDEETKGIIGTLYKKDIARFGYSF